MKLIENKDDLTGALKLTSTEAYLVRLFRQTNDESQRITIATMERYVENPDLRRAPPKPTLKVIAGGAQ